MTIVLEEERKEPTVRWPVPPAGGVLATYLVRGQPLGEARVPASSWSRAFFCSTCGKIWARIEVEGSPWLIETVPCEDHEATGVPDWGRMPGSILNATASTAYVGRGMWPACIEYLPPEVLRREFHLYLAHFKEREDENE